MADHHHRSGSQRQANKKNKRTSSSKRSIIKKQGGKIPTPGPASKRVSLKSTLNAKAANASQRKIFARQKRNIHRRLLTDRKQLTGRSSPSLILGVVGLSLGKSSSELIAKRSLLREAGVSVPKKSGGLTVWTHSETLIGRGSSSILDFSRSCDALLFVLDGAGDGSLGSPSRIDLIGVEGERVLELLKQQGTPSVSTLVVFSKGSSEKRCHQVKKYVGRMMVAEWGDDNGSRLYDMRDDLGGEGMVDQQVKSSPSTTQIRAYLRSLFNGILSRPKYWMVPRSHVVSEGGFQYDPITQELKIKGFVRNAPLNGKGLLHLTDIGTFAIQKVQSASGEVLVENYSTSQEGGVVFATPDALEGEQNLIGFDQDPDEDDEGEDGITMEVSKSEPAPPLNNYESAWLDGLDPDDSSVHDLSEGFNTKKSTDEGSTAMATGDATDDASEEKRIRALREDEQFPDEVELRRDESGEKRYARYRSLKNFKKSYWDPKENLPEDYNRLFHFTNFRGTQKDVLGEMEDITEKLTTNDNKSNNDCEMKDDNDNDNDSLSCQDFLTVGTPVSLTFHVPTHFIPKQTPLKSNPIISATSLLPHENKASILHIQISPSSSDELTQPIIKSKDLLTIRIGFRTFQSRPIFSHSDIRTNKHKYLKFLPTAGFCVMSVYAPVTYTPCPVMVFKDDVMVASGTVMGADADRIILKRSVLTGYPTRVHKRWATVKYMFFNPDDVKWFQPAGLTTKHGLRGNIVESVGDHGTMKCLFHKPIQQHDTVCLPLYKRVFPKFADEDEEDNDMGNSTVGAKGALVVW